MSESKVLELRKSGLSWRAIAKKLEIGVELIGAQNPAWEVAYCTYVLAANTTSGFGEIRHLRLKDIELAHQSGPIYVQPEGAKNNERIHRIPLNERALEAVKQLLTRAERLGSRRPDDYLLAYRIKTGTYDPRRPTNSCRGALR